MKINLFFKEVGDVEESIYTFPNGIKCLITRDIYYTGGRNNKHTYNIMCCGKTSEWMGYEDLIRYLEIGNQFHVFHRTDTIKPNKSTTK